MSITENREEMWNTFVQTRSSELRDALIIKYTPLVRFVVGRMGIPSTSLLDAEDLVSYGLIGLMNAVDRFDPARGVCFEAFASSRIRGAVIDQLRTLNWQPRSAVARVRQIEATLATLEQRLGRPATEVEVAAELGISTEKYRHMLQDANLSIISLDAPMGSLASEDEKVSLSELLEDASNPGPAEQVEQEEMVKLLSQAIDLLPERERILLSLYYHEELTMKEISVVMGVSESRVCQLHMQAVLRLRGTLNVDESGKTPGKKPRKPRATNAARTTVNQYSSPLVAR